jgi:transposase-like protein
VVARILGVLATTVHRWRRLANLAAWDAKVMCEQVVEALIDLAYRPDLLHPFVKAAGIPA